ncbi:YolD-like family protein [Tumebacillus sp. ITR2]|uniref:YolD-like family protein n=1 Tax=Tumebacillus amylolyticus TaxID=2801339 RepID=A0ABS1JAD8_9BACL|nr:YolD-like family protein [Tumebacillus amylolyticus]MBL0387250.1 YolD-like family protein [Tumebacillus amylolyticus]
MNRGNKLWEGHRMILPEHRARMLQHEVESYVVPVLHEDASEDIEYRVQEAMIRRQLLTIVVGEQDGEHTVEGRIVSYRTETRSLQIHNEWGRFQIPIQNIVRVL